jgi:hypothetical protein
MASMGTFPKRLNYCTMKIKFFVLFFSIFLIILMVLFSYPRWIQFLTYSKKAKANILSVEGWIPEYALNEAYDEFHNGSYDYIVTTGYSLPSHLTLFTNSRMSFFPSAEVKTNSANTLHTIFIHASSSLGDEDSCHFNLYINDRKIAAHYTSDNKGKFELTWQRNVNDIDSLIIEFDNDMVNEKGDRNLRIMEFTLNGYNLIIEHADVFLILKKQYRNISAVSYAELAAHYFTDRGIDPNKVIPVFNPRPNINRTYGNALAFSEWLEKTPVEVAGINVFSMDFHSRRTWLIYNKLIAPQYELGIISVPDLSVNRSRAIKFTRILKESAALLYYYILVLPWL